MNVCNFAGATVWFLAGLTRHAYVSGRLNAVAQMSPRAAHYYDIARFLIHDLTYKARTLSTQTCEPRRSPGLPSMIAVFHNTNKPQDVSGPGWPFLRLSGGTCLNGSHCQCICHPLFCGGFWQGPKVG